MKVTSHKGSRETMLRSHEILLQFRHDPRFEFRKTRVCYVDRGAPGDISCVDGSDIPSLEAYYFEAAPETRVKYIPYHRIRLILYGGVVVWDHAESRKKAP